MSSLVKPRWEWINKKTSFEDNPIKQEINNNNNYLQNDASNNLLCKNNNSVSNSNSNLSAALSETKKQNSITISLNYYNDQQQGNGHFFTKKTFHKPTYCHHCTEMLWGLMSQGFVCEGFKKISLNFFFKLTN